MNADTATLPQAPRLPWVVYFAVAGLACLPIGLIWDISHHSTIGRDTFWTPAHLLIQFGGILPAMLFALVVLKVSFRGTTEERAAAVSFWGLRAPLGAWVTAWGALAMLTSAPFDDWWHNRYGLDVKIISPPHSILGIGMLAVGLGVLLFVFSAQNRAAQVDRLRSGLICALTVGVLLTLQADFITELSWPNLQRTAKFYAVVAMPFPFLLVLAARAARVPAAATIAAGTYMAVFIFMILALPLFPAQPKLAPIYHAVDRMVPPAFPLLLIVPAVVIDLLMAGSNWFTRRGIAIATKAETPQPAWWRDWLLAAVVAVLFIAVMIAVQWPFSGFLLSDGADNRFFARSGHWPYFSQPGPWMNSFWERGEDPLTMKGAGLAMLRALISARLGLWMGNYLLRLKR